MSVAGAEGREGMQGDVIASDADVIFSRRQTDLNMMPQKMQKKLTPHCRQCPLVVLCNLRFADDIDLWGGSEEELQTTH